MRAQESAYSFSLKRDAQRVAPNSYALESGLEALCAGLEPLADLHNVVAETP
jgi:hypothetical protein